MKKIIKFFIIVILVVVFFFIAAGYKMYKDALNNSPITALIENVRDIENYTSIDQVPQIYVDAVVAVEDKRYYNHNGIDIISILRALYNDLRSMSYVEGGSTITQQLAKNAYFSQDKVLVRKIAEMFMAVSIEKEYSKDEIIEMYINSIYYGDGYYNIYDASIGYFGVEPINLTDYQATLLVGIPNAPSVYSLSESYELASQRQRQVLEKMIITKRITIEKANDIIRQSPIALDLFQ